jgi:neutral ceramidase
MKVGTAWVDITPGEPIPIMGQLGPRLGEYTHDPITVNAVVFDDAGVKAALVSCDLAMLPDHLTRRAQEGCSRKIGMKAGNVIIACTHTHLAPYTVESAIGKPEAAYIDRLIEAIVESVVRAHDDAEEVDLFAAKGWLDQMGFNRRGRHADGRVDMYHGSWNSDFAGIEGPRDGEVAVVCAKRGDGSVKVVISSFSTHPNAVERERYYSADVAGAVRSTLRRNLGDDLGVIYLTGAAGNTAPSILENNKQNIQPWRGEEGLKRSGLYLGGEILKIVAGATEPMADAKLRLLKAVVPIPIRQWPKDLDLSKFPAGAFRDYYEYSKRIWPELLKNENPRNVHLNVLRLGEAAICTNPAELFVEFGLAIKENSPASVTLICELADGYVGYVPTPQAIKNGGYCTMPATTSMLSAEAGDIMVANTQELLRQAFKEEGAHS